VVLADNRVAVENAMRSATANGFSSACLPHPIAGEARICGIELANELRAALIEARFKRPFVLIGGGEAVVHVTGLGRGGRNLEMALSAVQALDGLRDIALITLATDGEDSTTNAAGAIVTGQTYRHALSMSIEPEDYLSNNDSLSFSKSWWFDQNWSNRNECK